MKSKADEIIDLKKQADLKKGEALYNRFAI